MVALSTSRYYDDKFLGLADMFGTQFVGAIHGRLLTAWSVAGVIGPLLIGYIRDSQLAAGVSRAEVYDRTMYILAGFLVVGAICNALVRPVAARWFQRSGALAPPAARGSMTASSASSPVGTGSFDAKVALAWAIVCIPIAWGVYKTLISAIAIFQ